MRARYDAVVVGAGPNGLAAAVTLARRGLRVHLVEAADQVGGGCRTEELTLPGFHHDVGATVLPLVAMSRFFRELGPDQVPELVHPDAPLAHPLDGAEAVLLERSVDATAEGMGADAASYRALFSPLCRHADDLLDQFLGPLRLPRHPISVAAFGVPALMPAASLARVVFREPRARALFAGIAAHSMMSLRSPASASVGLVLGMAAHAGGWPVARGGSGSVPALLRAELEAHGGTVETGRRITSLRELPPARVQLLSLVPRDLDRVCGDALPARYRRRLRHYRYGPGIFKVDWALDAPIPWSDPRCGRAATVHLAGSFDEVVAAEDDVASGRHAARPFVLLVQASLFDGSRAPAGRHTAWAYCHVPNGSSLDVSAAIEDQVERFAPGFRDIVAARHVMDSAALEDYDANLVGGDINAGQFRWDQLFTRPTARIPPYTTPNPDIFIASASTPPGGGVHGMCGYWAARAALRRVGAA